jgi:hypothetical protein
MNKVEISATLSNANPRCVCTRKVSQSEKLLSGKIIFCPVHIFFFHPLHVLNFYPIYDTGLRGPSLLGTQASSLRA